MHAAVASYPETFIHFSFSFEPHYYDLEGVRGGGGGGGGGRGGFGGRAAKTPSCCVLACHRIT